MEQPSTPERAPMQALRAVALRYPEVQEGTACKKSSFKARKKAFLFMGMDDRSYNAMVKLRESLAEAAELAAREPDRYKVGAHGWVTATFSHDESPPPGLLDRWIAESYRVLAPKRLVALPPDGGLPPASAERTPKKPEKKAAKKTRRSR